MRPKAKEAVSVAAAALAQGQFRQGLEASVPSSPARAPHPDPLPKSMPMILLPRGDAPKFKMLVPFSSPILV